MTLATGKVQKGNSGSMDMTANDAVANLISELIDAWARADAKAFARRFSEDGTFTNIFGHTHQGHAEFEKRHADVFDGIFKGTGFELELLNLRNIRPDVALVDLETRVLGISKPLPPGINTPPPGAPLRTRLLLVLVKEDGDWRIAAYHNVDLKAPPAK